jgi:NAD-dependent DNA ligase
VLAEANSTSSKAEKARRLGIEVISEEQLMALLDGVEPIDEAPPPPDPPPLARRTPVVPAEPAPAPPAVAPAPKAPPAAPAKAAVVLRSLCISGKLPSGRHKSEYAAPLQAVGITLVDDVRPGLSYLVLADPASTSAKAEKARKLGVAVITEQQLQALVA